MDKLFVIISAVLILLLILLIIAVATDSQYAQKGYWMSRFVESPWQVYSRSAGNFDDAAALAFTRAINRENPTPSDHLLSATVITRNILSREHRPTGIPDDYVEADLRREMYTDARNHYMAALVGLDATNEQYNRNNRRDGINHQFIIDAALDFAFNGVHDLLINEPILAHNNELTFDNITIQFVPAYHQARMVDVPLINQADQRRIQLVESRKSIAENSANGVKSEAVDNYVELAVQNTNDPQNAHDTGVLACLRAIIDRLRADQGDTPVPLPDQVIREITAIGNELSEGRKHRLDDVIAVIERTRNGERVMALNVTDKECLGRVWLRASDSRNTANKRKLQQSLFDALYDSWEEGIGGERKIVCVNGRTSRILSSLILLDWDKRNWEVKKLEQFKNEIFIKTAEVIKETAEQAVKSKDTEMQKAGKLYLAKTPDEIKRIGTPSQEATDELEALMRTEINDMIDSYILELEVHYGAKDAIPPYMVESTKQEAMAAI